MTALRYWVNEQATLSPSLKALRLSIGVSRLAQSLRLTNPRINKQGKKTFCQDKGIATPNALFQSLLSSTTQLYLVHFKVLVAKHNNMFCNNKDVLVMGDAVASKDIDLC